MKIYAKGKVSSSLILYIEVRANYPEFPGGIAAADISDFDLPKGKVISKYKEKVTQEMVDDFESFMDNVEILCEENYQLVGTYKNVSSDHSHYYNYLAQDDEGNIVVDIRLRLRISNHSPKRTKTQQQNKKQELRSEELKRLLTPDQIQNLRPHTVIITVNDSVYDSYEDAFADVDRRIGRAVEIMARKSKT